MSRPALAPRVAIALLAILLYAGLSTARWARRAAQWPARSGADEISAYERRFNRLRAALPPTGVVGYLGDPDPEAPPTPGGPSPALLHFRRYLLAQYSLAPRLLVENTSPDFVIGNFEPGAEPPTPAGFGRPVDYGNGVVLFRRSQP
jgi:hypothetical protein